MKFIIPEYQKLYKLAKPVEIKWRPRLITKPNYSLYHRIDTHLPDYRLISGYLKSINYPGLHTNHDWNMVSKFTGTQNDATGLYIPILIPIGTVFSFGAFNLRSQYKGLITCKVARKNNTNNVYGQTIKNSFSLYLNRDEMCELEWDVV
jgi:hypothetical protein